MDQNGTIEFDEFLMLMAHKIQRVDEQEDLLTAFRVFDKNGDGYISASELKSVMESLGEEMTDEQIHEMIREADTDGNGLIDYSEFMYVLLLGLYVCVCACTYLFLTTINTASQQDHVQMSAQHRLPICFNEIYIIYTHDRNSVEIS